MGARYVSIRTGDSGSSDVISFSKNIEETPDKPAFIQFFEKRGYTIWEAPGRALNRLVRITPQLDDVHVYEFGILCVGGRLMDEEPVGGIVDAYHDEVVVADIRDNPIEEFFGIRTIPGGGVVVAQA